MKKLITILVLALGISINTQAQKKDRGDHKDNLTPKQKTELAVKKMTLKLDLTDSQVSQIKPLLEKRTEERVKMHEKRKASKEANKELTADQRYDIKNKKLDEKIAFKKRMKQILNEEQYKKFEKMASHRKGKHGKKGKKGKKDGECDKASCDHKK